MSQASNIVEAPVWFEHHQVEPYPRPEGLDYPKVWTRFEGRAREDGTIPRFRVQDLTEEYFDVVLSASPDFVREENTNKLMKTTEVSKEHKDVFRQKWHRLLVKKVSVICLTDDEEVPRVAGFNLNEVFTKEEFEDEADMVKNMDIAIPSIKEQAHAVYQLKEDGDVFKRYNVDRYMDAMGLYVFPEFRKNGIALQLLLARIPLCKALGIAATANTFSSHPVRSVATKAGFEVITEISIAEIGRRCGNHELPSDEYIKFMGRRI